MRLLVVLVLAMGAAFGQGNEDQHCDRQASTHCFTQRWPSTMSSSVVQYMPGKAWINAHGYFAFGQTTINDSTATGYVVGKVDEYKGDQDNEMRGINANVTFWRTTPDEATDGWDQFGISGVVIAGTWMSGGNYIRGQQKAVNSELYYQTPTTPYAANIGVNYLASLSQVAAGVTLGTWAGFRIASPGTAPFVTNGGTVVNGSGIWIEDLSTNSILTSATTAAIKIDGLNNFGRIQWPGGSLYPPSSGVLNYSGTNFNTAGSITVNTTPVDTAGYYMQMPHTNPGGQIDLTGVIQYSDPGSGLYPKVINIGHVKDVTATGTMSTVNMNISGTCTGSGCGGSPGVADIRSYGAVCDGTDQNTAVQAALAAGYTNFFIPANCHWIAPLGIIPANLGISCENWLTSQILSAADPTTLPLLYGSGTSISKCNTRGNSVNFPDNCPLFLTINATPVQQAISTTCWSSYDSISGYPGKDTTGAFFKVMKSTTDFVVDAVNISTAYGVGRSGNALRADNYNYECCAAILADVMPSAGAYGAIPPSAIEIANYATGKSPFLLVMHDSERTGGYMIDVNHNASSFNGDMLHVDMAQGSGTFTGNYLYFTNNNTPVFQVQSDGAVGMGAMGAPLYNPLSIAGADEYTRGMVHLISTGDSATILFSDQGSGASSGARNWRTGVNYGTMGAFSWYASTSNSAAPSVSAMYLTSAGELTTASTITAPTMVITGTAYNALQITGTGGGVTATSFQASAATYNAFYAPNGGFAGDALHLLDTGTHNIAFKAPTTVAANITFTVPGVDGTAGQSLCTNASAVLGWCSATSQWTTGSGGIYYSGGNVGLGTTGLYNPLTIVGADEYSRGILQLISTGNTATIVFSDQGSGASSGARNWRVGANYGDVGSFDWFASISNSTYPSVKTMALSSLGVLTVSDIVVTDTAYNTLQITGGGTAASFQASASSYNAFYAPSGGFAGEAIHLLDTTTPTPFNVAFKAPTTLAANITFTVPGIDGSNGQAICTNASAVLGWCSITPSQWTTSGSSIYYAGSVQANSSHTNVAGFYMTNASGTPVGIIQCDGSGGGTDCPSFSVGNVKNFAAAGDYTTIDGHHFGIGLQSILSETAGGTGTFLGFNATVVSGAYKALVTGNKAGYLEFDNSGFRIKTTNGTQTSGVTLASVVDVLDSDSAGNITLNGFLNASAGLTAGGIASVATTDTPAAVLFGYPSGTASLLQIYNQVGGNAVFNVSRSTTYSANGQLEVTTLADTSSYAKLNAGSVLASMSLQANGGAALSFSVTSTVLSTTLFSGGSSYSGVTGTSACTRFVAGLCVSF